MEVVIGMEAPVRGGGGVVLGCVCVRGGGHQQHPFLQEPGKTV